MCRKLCDIGFLFDLDGVIIDSEKEYTRIWSLINQEFPTGIERFEYKIKGCTLSKILEENYATPDLRKKVSDLLHKLEAEMHYEFLPSAEEFLLKLKNSSLPMALVTSSDNKKMAHLWEELPQLESIFDFIVTGDKVKESKPSPEGYLLAAKALGVSPQRAAVFEDSLQGVMAGKNANSYVVGISGTLPAETLAPFSHIVVEGLNEISLDHLIQKLKER